MLLIVDDERNWKRDHIPEMEVTIYARNVSSAKYMAKKFYDEITEISLDHDLGPTEDIREFVKWLVPNLGNFPKLGYIYVHSMNVVGNSWVVDMIKPHFKNVMRINLTSIGELI